MNRRAPTIRAATGLFPVALVLAVATTPASSAESFDGCANRTIATVPATITKPGRWCLASNLATTIASGTAIDIAASNVVLECNGFGVEGTAPRETTQAIGIAVNGENATVRGCRVIGFRTGIRMVGAAARVEDNTVRAQQRVGIHVSGDGGEIRGNFVRDVGDLAAIDTSTSRLIAGIVVDGNTDVIDNTVAGVRNQGDYVSERAVGIRLAAARGPVVRGNRVRALFAQVVDGTNGIKLGANTRGVGVTGNDLHDVGVAVFCWSANAGILRDNTLQDTGGGATMAVGCVDGGGNLSAP